MSECKIYIFQPRVFARVVQVTDSYSEITSDIPLIELRWVDLKKEKMPKIA